MYKIKLLKYILIGVLVYEKMPVSAQQKLGSDIVVSGEVDMQEKYYSKAMQIILMNGDEVDDRKPAGKSFTVPVKPLNGKFSVSIPNIGKYGYIRLQLHQSRKDVLGGYLLVVPGTKIFVKLTDSGMKMISQDPLLRLQERAYLDSRRLNFGATKKSDWAVPAFALLDSLLTVNKKVIYASKLNNELKEMLLEYTQTTLRSALFSRIYAKRNQWTPTQFQTFRTPVEIFEKSWQMQSKAENVQNLMDYAESVVRFYEIKSHFYGVDTDDRTRYIFDALASLPQTILRDKALSLFLILRVTAVSRLNLLDSGLKVIKTPKYYARVEQAYRAYMVGQPVYPFVLKDIKGRVYTPEDFKGKVVVLHFWYKGCGACAVLSKGLHPIIEAYGGNRDLIFVNVSQDIKRENWLEGLKSGLFTHPQELNLYTDGLGIQHPLITYYSLKGVPSMLLIDRQGNLITASPPIPGFNNEDTKKFKMLLDAYL